MVISSKDEDLLLALDKKRILHGEQEFIYEKVIRPGDKLYCQKKIINLYEKEGKSGIMQFLVLDTIKKDDNDNFVVTSRMNIIYYPQLREVN